MIVKVLRKFRRLFRSEPPPLEVEDTGLGQVTIRAADIEVHVSMPVPEFAPQQEYTPRPPITLHNAACPYCGVVQEPPPTRRKKCAECAEVIFPKTDRETRIRYLLTRVRADKWDRDERDKKWATLNRQVRQAYESSDFHSASMAHFQQALLLFEEGRIDHHPSAQLSRQDEVRYHRGNAVNLGYTKVQVVSQGDAACPACHALDGREYTFDQAIDQMPIPVRECETQADKNPHGGWCGCSYSPVLDWSSEN